MPGDLNQKIDIGEIYEENFDKLYKFFYYKVLSKDIAEDLTSETFLAFADIIKNSVNIEKPSHFLFGVAKNIFLRYLKDKYRQGIPFTDMGENFEEYCSSFVEEKSSDEETVEEKLLKYIKYIPDKQQVILKLRFIENLSLKEICNKLNKNMNYVKTMQKRGLRSLREALELVA